MASKLKELLEGAYQVCRDCGLEYGRNGARLKSGSLPAHISTFHNGVCDICDRDTAVTEFRDFGYERDLRPREKFTKEHLTNE